MSRRAGRRPAATIGHSIDRNTARHRHIDAGWRRSNLSAQSSATASGSLAKRPLCARTCRVMSRESFDDTSLVAQISRRQTWTDHRSSGSRGRSQTTVRSRRDIRATRRGVAWDRRLAGTNDDTLRFGMMPCCGGVRRSTSDQKPNAKTEALHFF